MGNCNPKDRNSFLINVLKYPGSITYSILFVFAILFYKERTAFMDASFVLFYIIKDSSTAIQNFRFGSILTQIFPLLAVKAGLSLKSIMLIYSISFVAFFASIYTVIKRILKNDEFSLALLLFNILIVSGTFYWIQSEQIQGSACLLLFYALLFKNPLKNRYPFINSSFCYILILTIVFLHPILIFIYLYISLFILLSNDISGKYPNKQEVISFLVYYIFVYLVKYYFFRHEYDTSAIEKTKNLISLFPHYLNIISNRKFIYYLFTDYYFLAILLTVCLIHYIKLSQFGKAFLLFSFFFVFLLIVNVTFKDTTFKFYMESHYLSLSLFVIIPFVFDVLPKMSQLNRSIIIFGIILIRVTQIYSSHTAFTNRLNWEREYIIKTSSLESKKIVTTDRSVPMDTLLMTWATPYEFWLLSTSEFGQSRSILILSNPNELNWALQKKTSFVTSWGIFDYKDLPKKYFILNDSTSYVKRN